MKTKIDILRNTIKATSGKIFSVRFIKADGSIRDMVCRISVHKGVKGNGSPMSEAKRLIRWRVFDMQKQAFRTIPIDRILSVKASGLRIEQVDTTQEKDSLSELLQKSIELQKQSKTN